MCEYCENTFSNKRNKNIMEGELKTFTGVPLCKFRTYLDVNQFDNSPEIKTDLFTYENYTEPENGTKLRELVISGGMQEINYCPYCGRRLNLKAPKLRSMREIYDTFGWKPEGWDIDDFDILDPKNPREENSEKLKKLVNSVFGVPEKDVFSKTKQLQDHCETCVHKTEKCSYLRPSYVHCEKYSPKRIVFSCEDCKYKQHKFKEFPCVDCLEHDRFEPKGGAE